jgi:DNA-binding HxlR family transcriptional regulator
VSIPALTHHRSALSILGELNATGGSRFVPLLARVGASREALRQALDLLTELGLVVPNPGYGHPSRPEYILTERGGVVAPACAELVAELRRLDLEDVGLKKWTLPVLVALDGERRFGEVAGAVGASPRALSLTLKDLVAAGLVERRVHAGYPPSTTYRVTRTGSNVRRRLARLVAAISQIPPHDRSRGR